MPRTLDDTYERILSAIDETYQSEARRALFWLAFSERPLSIDEVAEAACIDPDDDMPFDPEDRFHDPRNDILEILGSLVSTSARSPGDRFNGEDDRYAIKLAHFSVREYLLSGRLRNRPSAIFSASEVIIHKWCTESCLAYIFLYEESYDGHASSRSRFPFLTYACKYWPNHARHIPETREEVEPLLRRFYSSERTFSTWRSLLPKEYYGFTSIDHPSLSSGTLSPLNHASMVGLPSILCQLLAETVDSAECTREGWTALHFATSCGNTITVELLLQSRFCKSLINVVSPKGETPLQIACTSGFEAIVSLLLRYGASIDSENRLGKTALSIAASLGNGPIAQQLLENGKVTKFEKTKALHIATQFGYFALVKLLLEHGAGTDAVSRNKITPLAQATSDGKIEFVQLLLEHGADPNSFDDCWNSALHRAAQKGSEELVQLLLKYGCDAELGDGDGKTPFHYACARGSPAILRVFLKHGVSLSLADGLGKMGIHYAAWAWDEEAIQLLLDHGADIEARTRRNETPLQLAAQRGGDMVVKCLLQHGADIMSQNMYGRTALHFAAVRGNGSVLQLLLEHGADPRVKDFSGYTPRDALHQYEIRARTVVNRITRIE